MRIKKLKFIKKASFRFDNLFYIFSLFSNSEKIKLSFITFTGILLSIFDLVGVILIGLVGSLATLGITGEQVGGLTKLLLEILRIDELERISQMSVIGGLAGLFLISKTIVSYFIQKRLAAFVEARVTALLSRFLRSIMILGLRNISQTPKRELLQSLQSGIPNLVSGVTIPTVMMVSDVSLIFVLGAALFFTEPILALTTTILFSLAALLLHFRLSIKQRRMGAELSRIMLNSHLNFEALINGFREVYVRDVRENLILKIEDDRQKTSRIMADFAVLTQINKYAFEVTMVIGAALIVSQQFLVSNSSRAVAIIGLFIASSFRIGPAILRIQFCVMSVRRAIARSDYTLKILRELKFDKLQVPPIHFKPFPDKQWIGGCAIELLNIDFRYSNNSEYLIEGFNFVSIPGEHIAIVGKSGVGKTTLVDLMVGALSPTKGVVKLFGLDPKNCISKYPGTISYLPQEIVILNGTIRENICFGYETSGVPEYKIWNALSQANLGEWVKSLDRGLDFIIWDNGANISGGQRQRLGLARALLTEPELLILDEATSALDRETQSEISSSLRKLKGKVTLVTIAHRLESIRHTDRVIEIVGPRQMEISGTDIFLSSMDSESQESN